MRQARLGKKHSEETKAKIRAALLGRKKPPETVARMTEVRRARPRMTPETVIMECKKNAKARWSWMATTRVFRWKSDQRHALFAGNEELFLDVKKSGGWTAKRRMKGYSHLGVTDGYWGRDLRAEFKAWKASHPHAFKRKVQEQGRQPSLYRKESS